MLGYADLALIERAICELLDEFQVNYPPVPVELIMQRPKPGMWTPVDSTMLTNSAFKARVRYGFRMSVAKGMALAICQSDWGEKRGLDRFAMSGEGIRTVARALLMPRHMVEELKVAVRTTTLVSMKFEIPDADAQQRMLEISTLNVEYQETQ